MRDGRAGHCLPPVRNCPCCLLLRSARKLYAGNSGTAPELESTYRRSARRIGIEMPENGLLSQLYQCRIGGDPAAQVTSALADRLADLCGSRMANGKCRNHADNDRRIV